MPDEKYFDGSPALRVRDLWVGYGKKMIIRGISFELPEREILGICGLNGAGKSTLLKGLFGVVRPLRGEIKLGQTEIFGMLPFQVQRLGMGYLLQGGRIFKSHTVLEHFRLLGLNLKKEDLYFQEVSDLFHRRAGLLSGGEKQILTLELSLQAAPKILLLDEPSAALSPNIAQRAFRAIEKFSKTQGASILLVEQNVELARQITTRELHLEDGQVSINLPIR